MNNSALRQSLKAHEGEKPKLYLDQNGHQTGGIGHNFDNPMRPELMALILGDDIQVAVNELARAHPGWDSHSDARQNVLIELMFAMGAPTLGQFHAMWAALMVRDYAKAAAELLDSDWANQVHGRAKTLANRLEHDLFTP